MKKFGWVYLLIFTTDAIFSVISSLYSPMEKLSGNISLVSMILSITVLQFAISSKLYPKHLFITLSGYYLGMVLFGLILTFTMIKKIGSESLPTENILPYLQTQFSWFGMVHWTLLTIWCCLAAYGFTELSKFYKKSKEHR